MSFAYELIGKRFGSLTVIEKTNDRRHKEIHWLCKCDCGNEYVAMSSHLVHGRTTCCKECACKKRSHSVTKHGCEPRKLYRAYANMKNRCNNPNYYLFNRYGGRGIKVCDEWSKSFVSFREWSFKNGYDKSKTLDRIDNNGNYCPENCRWTTMIIQQNNRSTNRLITINGVTDTLANWARKSNLTYGCLQGRLDSGKSPEEAILPRVR